MGGVGSTIGRRARLILGLFLLVSMSPDSAAAQDSQWWTNQYGNRARLLGGAVIGSSRDLSSVYYNPGGLALVDQPDALLTGYVFELDNIKYTDVLLEDTELSSTRFDAVAGLIAGQLPLNFLGDSRLAYSYLTRHNLEYRFNEGGTISGDSLADFEGIETVSAAITYETRLREYWGGLTWSSPFLDDYGFGISLFVANRSQRLRYQTNLTATGETEGVATVSGLRRYDYYDWRVLTKIGLSTSFQREAVISLTKTWRSCGTSRPSRRPSRMVCPPVMHRHGRSGQVWNTSGATGRLTSRRSGSTGWTSWFWTASHSDPRRTRRS